MPLEKEYLKIIKGYLADREKSSKNITESIETIKKELDKKNTIELDDAILTRGRSTAIATKTNSISDPVFDTLKMYEKIRAAFDNEVIFRLSLLDYYYTLLLFYDKIDTCVGTLTYMEKDVIQKVYFEKKKISNVIAELDIGSSKFYKYQRSAFNKIISYLRTEDFDNIIRFAIENKLNVE